jgi:acyl-CoA synthetase (NDP forming)
VNVDLKKLERAFNPKTIAIIGDKKGSNYMWLRSHMKFTGKLYSVQVDPAEIEGIKELGIANYTSVMEIPEPVDLAIVAVPRHVAPRVLGDMIKKDVAAAHFFTAGFSETDTDEGRQLEKVMVDIAEQGNFHIVGPNCMGVFVPHLGVGQGMQSETLPAQGPVGFISQSGTHAVTFNRHATLQGLGINKTVSFGNGIVLDSADYLEYFGQDPTVKIIGMYIEGIKNSRRFLKVLKDVTARKPVVIWKGGRTEEGDRAIASHTGSLAVSHAVWDSAVKQCGAIGVGSLDQMIDTLKAILFLPPVTGKRVGITGVSGGQSVAISDAFGEAGLSVPTLTEESYAELASFYSLIGGGYRNPIDTANQNGREIRRIVDILDRDANIDNLALLASVMGPGVPPGSSAAMLKEIRENTRKPLVAILVWSFSPQDVEQSSVIMKELQEAGIPAFLTLERGAFALKKALEYYALKNRG